MEVTYLSDDDYEKEIERARRQGAIEALERFSENMDALASESGWDHTRVVRELLTEYRKEPE